METGRDRDKQHSEAAAFRNALRSERIAAREALPAGEHARKSAAILQQLHDLLTARRPQSFSFYWPIRGEVDCTPLALRLIDAGWQACLPAIVERHAAMTFREWIPGAGMMTGEHGIATVANGKPVVPQVMLLPVNVFDRNGYRLGYGGGYFDRTLATLAPRPFTVGVGFALGRVESIRPHAKDIAMNAVVTEEGVETLSARP